MTSLKYRLIIDHSLMRFTSRILTGLVIVLIIASQCDYTVAKSAASKADPLVFDDTPLREPLSLPSWFKLSFLDLREDLADANRENRGLIIYFGRHDCAYCKALLEKNWGQDDIVSYTKRYFDVIGIDVLGNRPLTDVHGKEQSEKEFAARQKANFTPTLHIYDRKGKLAHVLTGYRPPYQFKAVLEYVADEHYLKEKFSTYYSRAEKALEFGNADLNRHPAILHNNKLINLSQSQKPVLVLFERPRCHACDVLHGGPLENALIIQWLKQFNAVQLDVTNNQPIITPAGKRTTSKAWAGELYLDYTPTLMFFDEQGNEILRIDSVVWFYRLRNVLDYVLDKGYLKYPTFQQWRSSKKQ